MISDKPIRWLNIYSSQEFNHDHLRYENVSMECWTTVDQLYSMWHRSIIVGVYSTSFIYPTKKFKKFGDIWCIYRFGGLIDGYSSLGVVYEVSLEVVLTTHAWCAGDAGIAIWRARLFAAHLRVGAWSGQTYKLYWDEISFIVKLNWVYVSVLHNGKPIGYRS